MKLNDSIKSIIDRNWIIAFIDRVFFTASTLKEDFFLSMKKFFLFYFLFAFHSLKSGITISKLVNKSTTTLTNTIQWYMFCFHMKTRVLIFGVKCFFNFFFNLTALKK